MSGLLLALLCGMVGAATSEALRRWGPAWARRPGVTITRLDTLRPGAQVATPDGALLVLTSVEYRSGPEGRSVVATYVDEVRWQAAGHPRPRS